MRKLKDANGLLLVGLLLAALNVHGEAGIECVKPVTEVYREVAPSVVYISAISMDPFRAVERVQAAMGSGVIIDRTGRILTNSHVVHGSNVVSVTLDGGMVVPVEVLGTDPILDIAVLKLPPLWLFDPGLFDPDELDPDSSEMDLLELPMIGAEAVARLGDSDAVEIGQDVVAIGNPMGLEQTVTHGIVSGLNRVLPESTMSWLLPYIQTDAAVNPGSSGGPLVNLCGEVVGINTAVIAEAENIGFAIPINVAKDVMRQLVEHGRVIRPWHGIYGKLVSADLQILLNIPLTDGFLIETIEPGSPAEKVGLQAGVLPLRLGAEEYLLGGDIITAVNGERLRTMADVLRVVRGLKVGDSVKLEYFRDGEVLEAEVVLPERPILPGDIPRQPEQSRTRLRGPLPLLPVWP